MGKKKKLQQFIKSLNEEDLDFMTNEKNEDYLTAKAIGEGTQTISEKILKINKDIEKLFFLVDHHLSNPKTKTLLKGALLGMCQFITMKFNCSLAKHNKDFKKKLLDEDEKEK